MSAAELPTPLTDRLALLRDSLSESEFQAKVFESHKLLEQQVAQLQQAPLCGDHAQMWFTCRPTAADYAPTGCMFCHQESMVMFLVRMVDSRIHACGKCHGQDLRCDACKPARDLLSKLHWPICPDCNHAMEHLTREIHMTCLGCGKKIPKVTITPCHDEQST